MINIQIKLLANYSKYLPPQQENNQIETRIAENTNVLDLVERLGVPLPPESVVLVNGVSADPEQTLDEGDVVFVFPAMAGGKL